MKYLRQIRPAKNKNTSSIPIRMNIILGIIFVLFLLLIGQLAYLQIVYGGRFETEVQKSDQKIVSNNVPRGVIYDSRGRVLVGNKANSAITYTRGVSLDSAAIRQISDRLANYIDLTDEKPTKRDLADYYLASTANTKKETQKLPKSQKYSHSGQALDDSVIYKNLVSQVMHEDRHYTDKEKTAAVAYKKISGATQLTTVYIKNKHLSNKELALVGENLSRLPGVGIGTDWERDYPNGNSIQSIIGSVSTEKSGLPSDDLQYYLSQGYSRNDRVGTSYLEKEYESLLKGTKSQSQVKVTAKNKVEETKTIYQGTKGSTLNLTIDSKYQQLVQQKLEKVYAEAKSNGAATYSDGAYAVALNPNTGAIYAVAGINHNPKTNKDTDDALGTLNRSFVMGSVVKGATVLGGLMAGAISPTSNTLPDTPIYLPGTPVKKSVYPIGTFSSLDAPSALEVSSNIYMMQLTLKWMHAKYVPHSYISMDQDAFEKQRRNFAQFGLGVKTGIDLPGETAGQKGASFNSEGNLLTGSVLDEAYGNYDAYTVMQLGQYVSTIANGGYRMRPYVVQSIGQTSNDGSTSVVYNNTDPEPLNRVAFTMAQLNVVKEGFYRVVHGSNGWGTAHTLANIKPEIAGKTGTAQTFYFDPDKPNNPNPPETLTSSFVGYAPAKSPKIAVAIVFPNITSEAHYNLEMAQEMFQDYFSLHPDEK